MIKRSLILFGIAMLLWLQATADDAERHEIKIVNHKFEPSVLSVSSGKVIKLKVINTDPTVEEFESFDLKREKIVASNSSITVSIGPLAPGEYHFFGEFHQETAQGKLIVK